MKSNKSDDVSTCQIQTKKKGNSRTNESKPNKTLSLDKIGASCDWPRGTENQKTIKLCEGYHLGDLIIISVIKS